MFAGVRREMAARLSLRALFCYVQWRLAQPAGGPASGKNVWYRLRGGII